MSRAWYCYVRTGSVALPENYIYTSTKPTNCPGGRIICCLYAIYAGINPLTISVNLQSYIAACQATGLAQPSSPVGAKKFVYCLPN